MAPTSLDPRQASGAQARLLARQVMAAGSVPQLRRLFHEHSRELAPAHVCAFLTRLKQLPPGSAGSADEEPEPARVSALRRGAQRLAGRVGALDAPLRPGSRPAEAYQVSQLVSALLQCSLRLLPEFEAREMAGSWHALARLGIRPRADWTAGALQQAEKLLPSTQPHQLSALMWSLGELRVDPGPAWLDALCAASAVHMLRGMAPRGPQASPLHHPPSGDAAPTLADTPARTGHSSPAGGGGGHAGSAAMPPHPEVTPQWPDHTRTPALPALTGGHAPELPAAAVLDPRMTASGASPLTGFSLPAAQGTASHARAGSAPPAVWGKQQTAWSAGDDTALRAPGGVLPDWPLRQPGPGGPQPPPAAPVAAAAQSGAPPASLAPAIAQTSQAWPPARAGSDAPAMPELRGVGPLHVAHPGRLPAPPGPPAQPGMPQLLLPPAWHGLASGAECSLEIVATTAWGLARVQHNVPPVWSDTLLAYVASRWQQLDAWSAANLVWALCTLGVEPPGAWLAALCRQSQELLRSANSFSLSVLLWALAVWGYRPPHEWLSAWLVAGSRLLPSAPPEHISRSLWSLAQLKVVPPRRWMRNMYEHTLVQAFCFTAQSFSLSLWAVARLGTPPPLDWVETVLMAAYEQGLETWTPQELSTSMGALARLGHRPEAAWLDLLWSETYCQLQHFSGQQLVTLLWAAVKLRVDPGQHWIRLFCKVSQAALPSLTPWALANLAWSMSRTHHCVLPMPSQPVAADASQPAGDPLSAGSSPPGQAHAEGARHVGGDPALARPDRGSHLPARPQPGWATQGRDGSTHARGQPADEAGDGGRPAPDLDAAADTWQPAAAVPGAPLRPAGHPGGAGRRRATAAEQWVACLQQACVASLQSGHWGVVTEAALRHWASPEGSVLDTGGGAMPAETAAEGRADVAASGAQHAPQQAAVHGAGQPQPPLPAAPEGPAAGLGRAAAVPDWPAGEGSSGVADNSLTSSADHAAASFQAAAGGSNSSSGGSTAAAGRVTAGAGSGAWWGTGPWGQAADKMVTGLAQLHAPPHRPWSQLMLAATGPQLRGMRPGNVANIGYGLALLKAEPSPAWRSAFVAAVEDHLHTTQRDDLYVGKVLFAARALGINTATYQQWDSLGVLKHDILLHQ